MDSLGSLPPFGAERSWDGLQPGAGDVLPQIRSRSSVYSNPFQEIFKLEADFGTFSKDYYVTYSGPRAGILVLDEDRVLLARQYRLMIDRFSWEIPGGEVNSYETPDQAARRECFEETGVRCSNLQSLITYDPSLDAQYNPTTIFYSKDIDEIPGPDFKFDHKEVCSIEWVPFSQCIEMIFAQQIVDHFTMIPLFAYQTMQGNRDENEAS